jgi:hypothetical protein
MSQILLVVKKFGKKREFEGGKILFKGSFLP